jgi:hypothetical protein
VSLKCRNGSVTSCDACDSYCDFCDPIVYRYVTKAGNGTLASMRKPRIISSNESIVPSYSSSA